MKANKQAKLVIHPNLAETKKSLKKFYVEFADSHESSSLAQQTHKFLSKFLEISGFVLDAAGPTQNSFQSLIEKKVTQSWPVFKELFPILCGWINESKLLTVKEQQAQETVLQSLEKSIKQYQVLSKSTKDPEEIELSKKVLELLLESKKKIKNLYKKEAVRFSSRTEASQQEIKSISDIFNFYAKQHIMTGRNPTFDKLGEIVENMDSGSFLAFSKHFGIYSKKANDKRYLMKDEVLKIFKHCATLQKSMNLQGFTLALDEIAELYFNEEFEKLSPVKCAGLDLPRKRIMLYEILKLDNAHYVNKTCVPIRSAFGPAHDKIAKTGKKENEEEIKEQILKYKQEKANKNKALVEEQAKKSSEKSKVADLRLKERKEQEDLQKRKDVLKLEDLEKGKFQDPDDVKHLEDLIE